MFGVRYEPRQIGDVVAGHFLNAEDGIPGVMSWEGRQVDRRYLHVDGQALGRQLALLDLDVDDSRAGRPFLQDSVAEVQEVAHQWIGGHESLVRRVPSVEALPVEASHVFESVHDGSPVDGERKEPGGLFCGFRIDEDVVLFPGERQCVAGSAQYVCGRSQPSSSGSPWHAVSVRGFAP